MVNVSSDGTPQSERSPEKELHLEPVQHPPAGEVPSCDGRGPYAAGRQQGH